jgi:uncharacterized membrane protein YfcA
LLGGLLGGLLGVGGGFVMIPLLVLWAKVPQHKANGTSLLAIVPIAIVGALVYYFQGSRPQVDLHFALLVIVGSVIGAYLGARAMNRIPEAQLKVAVVVLMVAVGLKELIFT